MDALRLVGERLNDVATILETIPDDAERKALRRPLGEMIALLFTDLQLPIIRQHRDLDPDKDADWYKNLVAKRAQPDDGSTGDV
jgi:hypothetical protein